MTTTRAARTLTTADHGKTIAFAGHDPLGTIKSFEHADGWTLVEIEETDNDLMVATYDTQITVTDKPQEQS